MLVIASLLVDTTGVGAGGGEEGEGESEVSLVFLLFFPLLLGVLFPLGLLLLLLFLSLLLFPLLPLPPVLPLLVLFPELLPPLLPLLPFPLLLLPSFPLLFPPFPPLLLVFFPEPPVLSTTLVASRSCTLFPFGRVECDTDLISCGGMERGDDGTIGEGEEERERDGDTREEGSEASTVALVPIEDGEREIGNAWSFLRLYLFG